MYLKIVNQKILIIRKKISLFLTLGLIVFILSSCSSYFYQDKVQSELTKLEIDSALVHGTLKNGFRYYLYKNSTPENRVSIHLDVLAGSMHEKDNQQGLAHYLEHMLFNGSTHFKSGELIEFFQSIGMDFGADANAHTGFFETVYDLLLPNGDKKSLEKALIVVDDYARGALLSEKEIESERGIIFAEKRDRDSVRYRTFKSSLEFELPESRIIKRYPIGIKQTLNSANKTVLKDFYDTWYCPDNMMLIMVGDFETTLAENLIKKQFSSLKTRKSGRFEPENTFTEHQGIKIFYHYEPESGSTDVSIGVILKKDFKPQTFDDLKIDIKRNIADSILQNRLSKLTGKKDTPFSDTSVYSGTYLKNICFASIGAETTPENWERSLSYLENHLRKALIFGFTQKELDRAKAEYINSLESNVKKATTRNSEKIASNIIYHLNNKMVFQSPQKDLQILKPFIKSLNINEINKSFINTWESSHRLIMVTGNTRIGKNKDSAEKIIFSKYKKFNKMEVIQYKDSKNIVFPYLPKPMGHSKIKTKKEFPSLGITTIDYENLVRLNLKKTQFKKGEFLFNVAVKGGRITVPESKIGINMVAEDLLNESCFGNIDKEELREVLSGTSVDINFNIEPDLFSFSGKGDPVELKLVFELIYSYLIDPAFREDSLKLVLKRYNQSFNSFKRTIDGKMSIAGDKFLRGGNSHFGVPEPEVVNKITTQDVKNWLTPYFNNASFEISLVGDFDLIKAEQLSAYYFGSLPKRDNSGIRSTSKVLPKFPENEKLILKVDTKINKTQIRIAFLTDDSWDITQTRGLNLLARVFSEKCRKIIREKYSLAYSTYVYNNPSYIYDNFGILQAVVSSESSNTDFILKNIKDIANSLALKGVSEKELDLVRKPTLNYIRDIKKTNKYWLYSVMSNSFEHPQKFDWAENIFKDYSTISSKTISLLAKKFLNVEKSAKIIIKPTD